MSSIIPVTNANSTPKQYLDNSRPISMVYADETFEKLTGKHGSAPDEVLGIMTTLSSAINSTKGYDVDQLWNKIEKALNNDRTLRTKGRTNANKAQIAVSFFYTALNMIDQQAKDTQSYVFMKSAYDDVKSHVENKFLSTFESRDQRIMLRIFDTIDNRFEKVGERMNEDVENGVIAGPKISL